MNETIKATLTADGTQFNREFEKTQATIGKFQSGMAKAAKLIGGLFAGRALLSGINKMRQEIDDLGKTATRLQLPTAQVQILSVAAQHGGSDIDALVASLNRAQVAATEAGRGTSSYAREFDLLNINIDEFQKLDPQARLRVLADAYKNATDRGEAFTSLTRIMGRGVSNLIPLLSGGSAALDELAGKVKVLDEDSVRGVEALNDEITLLSQNIKTELMQAFVEAQPIIEAVFKQVAQSITDIAKLNELVTGLGGKGQESTVGDALMLMELIEKHEKNAFWYGTRRLEIAKKRLQTMPEEIRMQAELGMETKRLAEAMASGGMSRKDGEARYRDLIDQHAVTVALRKEEETRAALEAEQSRNAPAEETAEAYEAQAKAMEALAKSEEKARAELQKRLQDSMSMADQLASVRAEAEAIRKANGDAKSLDFMRGRIDTIDDPKERLKAIEDLSRLLELRDQAKGIQDEINRAAEASAQEQQRAAEEALEAKQREIDAALTLARIKASQDQARSDVAAETRALELELAGRKDLADNLREEVRLRADAARLAEQMGTTEAQALAILRMQADMRRQINQQDGQAAGAGGHTSRIRRAPRFSSLGEDRRLDGSGPTLRQAALTRRGDERRAADGGQRQFAKAETILANQENLQQEMLKHFNRIMTI